MARSLLPQPSLCITMCTLNNAQALLLRHRYVAIIATFTYLSTRNVEKIASRVCQCTLKINSYYTEKEAFSPLHAFQVQSMK